MNIQKAISSLCLIMMLIACGGQVPAYKSFDGPHQGYTSDDLYRFFAVAFGAAPGVTYGLQLLEAADSGMSLRAIVNVFTNKPQFTETYPPSLSHQDFATKLVDNVVGNSASQEAKAEAVADIVKALALPGWTRGDVIYAIFNNLANKKSSDNLWYTTAQKLANQVAYAKYFTQVMQYNSTDLQLLRNVIALIDHTTNTNGDLAATITRLINPLFASKPILLPDLYDKYNKMCNPRDVNIQTVIAANLAGHKDGKKDLLVGLWCQPVVGAVIDAPTVNGIVAFIQQNDGTFTDATRLLFGVDLLDAGGGVPVRSVAYDFNQDGYDEVFFALTGEDGRILPQGYTGYNRQNFVLTSLGNGKYRSEKIGWPSYNYLAKLVNGPNGTPDVMTSTIGYGGKDQVFRLINGFWQSVDDYINAPTHSASFYNSNDFNHPPDSSIVPKNGNSALSLFKKQSSGQWIETDSVSIGLTQTAQFRTWNTQVSDLTILTIDGKDYGMVSFSDNCIIRNANNNSKYSLLLAPAARIVGGFKPGRFLVESDPNDFSQELIVLAYKENLNKLDKVSITFRNFLSDQKFFTLNCNDLNGDGIDDLFMSNWGEGQKPNIYINSVGNVFSLVDPALLPLQSSSNNGSIALYEDIDGDGIRDMVYVPQNGVLRSSSIRFHIFKGLRKPHQADALN